VSIALKLARLAIFGSQGMDIDGEKLLQARITVKGRGMAVKVG